MNITIFGACCESLSIFKKRKDKDDSKEQRSSKRSSSVSSRLSSFSCGSSITTNIEKLEDILIEKTNQVEPKLTSIMVLFTKILNCEISVCGLFDKNNLNLFTVTETTSWESASLEFFRLHGFERFNKHAKSVLYNGHRVDTAFVMEYDPRTNPRQPPGHPKIKNYGIIPLAHFGRVVGAIVCVNLTKKGVRKFSSNITQLETACTMFSPLLIEYWRKSSYIDSLFDEKSRASSNSPLPRLPHW